MGSWVVRNFPYPPLGVSVDCVESLDYHPSSKGGVRKGLLEKQDFHPCPPTPQQSGPWRQRGSSNEVFLSLPVKPNGEPELPPLNSSNEDPLPPVPVLTEAEWRTWTSIPIWLYHGSNPLSMSVLWLIKDLNKKIRLRISYQNMSRFQ